MAYTGRRTPAITALVEDVGDLRAFGLVVDLQSVTAAAGVLGESKATTSRRISRLEASLGVPLLRRTSRVVEVTEEGRSYRERIGEVLELLAHANANAKSIHQEPHGDLRVGAPPGLSRFVGPLVAAFASKQPDVHVSVEVSNRAVDFDVDEIDAAFAFHNEGDDLELQQLQLICVATPAYVREHGKPQTLLDLKKHKLVAHQSSDDRDLNFVNADTRKTTTFRVKPTVAASALDMLIEVVLDNFGIGIVPSLVVDREISAGRLVRLLPSHSAASASLTLRVRRARNLPSKVIAFREFIRDYMRQLPSSQR